METVTTIARTTRNRSKSFQQRGKQGVGKCLIAILLWLLTACNTDGIEPNIQIVQGGLAKFNELIALQLNLLPQPASFEINHLTIAQKTPLKIQNLTAYRISGTYNLVSLPRQQVIKKQNNFEIYLQRQKEGKTWRLLVPQSIGKEHPVWLTYSLSKNR